jgi:beta-lysine 5,6-aminomutase beta subunit
LREGHTDEGRGDDPGDFREVGGEAGLNGDPGTRHEAPADAERRDGLEHVKPYADHHGDGIVQLSFTLPVPDGIAARKAALELASKMGFQHPEVVHHERLTDTHTYFVMYGHTVHSCDYATLAAEGDDIAQYMTEEEIEAYAQEHIQRPVVVVGASTGTDTHSVGIDAMLNLKGFHGHKGLEGYRAFHAHNLGSQIPNSTLVAKAIELDADAILVSQTVTQQNLHIHNLTELVEIVEAEGRRRELILACGGPRVSGELAKELGYDAGFSKGTYPHHLATFLVRELAARLGRGEPDVDERDEVEGWGGPEYDPPRGRAAFADPRPEAGGGAASRRSPGGRGSRSDGGEPGRAGSVSSIDRAPLFPSD